MKSTWNLYFPNEYKEHQRVLFNRINRVPVADYDWTRVAGKYLKERVKAKFRITFDLLDSSKDAESFFKVLSLLESPQHLRFFSRFWGKEKYSLTEFLNRSKGGKFDVFIECPTGIVLEGTFPSDVSLSTVLKESSRMYYSGYEKCFSITKQGDVVPCFSEFYLKEMSLYKVRGRTTLVIRPKVDRKANEIHPECGRSYSVVYDPEEDQGDGGELEDLYKDL